MPPIAVHEVTTFYNMYNQAAGRAVQAQRLHQPAVPAARRPARAGAPVPLARHRARAAPPPTALFTVQKSECLGACADAPVLLVNDRQMVSFMSDARLDELVSTLRCAGGSEPA